MIGLTSTKVVFRTAFFLGICAFACGSSGAQQITASALVERAATAHGVGLTDGTVGEWTGEGKIKMTGTEAERDFTIVADGRGRFQRTVTDGDGNSVKYGSNGKDRWQSSGPFSGPAVGRVLHFIEGQTERSLASLFAGFSRGYPITDLGPAAQNSEFAGSRMIEAKNDKGQVTRYYIDDATGLITCLEFDTGEHYTLLFDKKKYPKYATFVFSDYRNVDGIMTPFKVEYFHGKIKIEEMRFLSVRHNTGIGDEVFVP